MSTAQPQPGVLSTRAEASRAGLGTWVRLARPKQWVKGLFVVIGPVYGQVIADQREGWAIWATALAFVAFGLASSACYVINDIQDREADAAHPRKRRRPIASGAIAPGAAGVFAVLLMALAAAAVAGVWLIGRQVGEAWWSASGPLLAGVLALYVINTVAYSSWIKHVVILDVMSLSLGFVLRVLAGCAAVMVVPSTWLLNVTLFVAMFLAFGKRLGERRTVGAEVQAARRVQASYTDALLRMVVVVTGVGALITYSGYVQSRAEHFHWGFNLLWLTMLPATFALFRCMLLLETGAYDDPTELAGSDRPFQLAVVAFGLISLLLLSAFKRPAVAPVVWERAGIVQPARLASGRDTCETLATPHEGVGGWRLRVPSGGARPRAMDSGIVTGVF